MTQAMRAFAAWVTRRPFRLVLLTILFVQLLMPIAGALLVLDALRRGTMAAALSAAIATAAVLGIGLALGAGAINTLSVTAPVLLLGVASGGLLVWSRSLSLGFQGTVVGVMLGALVVFALFADPMAIGTFLRREFLLILESGGVEAAQLEQFEAITPIELTRVVLIALLGSALLALLLGYWCYSLIVDGIHFGSDFRALRLGRVAGIVLMVAVTAYLLVGGDWLASIAPLAVIGFLFQGLAVLHARSHAGNWHRAVIVLVYLLFVSPLAQWVFMGVSAVGLLDNFFNLRTPPERRV